MTSWKRIGRNDVYWQLISCTWAHGIWENSHLLKSMIYDQYHTLAFEKFVQERWPWASEIITNTRILIKTSILLASCSSLDALTRYGRIVDTYTGTLSCKFHSRGSKSHFTLLPLYGTKVEGGLDLKSYRGKMQVEKLTGLLNCLSKRQREQAGELHWVWTIRGWSRGKQNIPSCSSFHALMPPFR